jgi:hypothetical protein
MGHSMSSPALLTPRQLASEDIAKCDARWRHLLRSFRRGRRHSQCRVHIGKTRKGIAWRGAKARRHHLDELFTLPNSQTVSRARNLHGITGRYSSQQDASPKSRGKNDVPGKSKTERSAIVQLVDCVGEHKSYGGSRRDLRSCAAARDAVLAKLDHIAGNQGRHVPQKWKRISNSMVLADADVLWKLRNGVPTEVRACGSPRSRAKNRECSRLAGRWRSKTTPPCVDDARWRAKACRSGN